MNTDGFSSRFIVSFLSIFVLFALAVINERPVSAGDKTASIVDARKLALMKVIKRGDYVVLSNSIMYLVGASFSETHKSIVLWRPGVPSFELKLKDAGKIREIIKSKSNAHRKLFPSFI
jgi:hypothetical protein